MESGGKKDDKKKDAPITKKVANTEEYVDISPEARQKRMMEMINHARLDRGVVQQAKDCNTPMEGEGSEAIACKISNMKSLDQALKDKQKAMDESEQRAKMNQAKVKGSIKGLEEQMKAAKAKEAKEEALHKKEVDQAVAIRMRELEGCERAKLTADMMTKRACIKADSDMQMK